MAKAKQNLPGWKKTVLLHLKNIEINNTLINTGPAGNRPGHERNVDQLLKQLNQMSDTMLQQVDDAVANSAAVKTLDDAADQAQKETDRIKNATNKVNAAANVVTALAGIVTGFKVL